MVEEVPGNDDRVDGLLGCPECGSRIQLRQLVSKEDIKAFGCGLRVPLIAHCAACALVYPMNVWKEVKSETKKR